MLRNFLFDKHILKSASFNFPIICVGNLATGGTGKTPMTEYLIDILQKNYKPATLSRGYKRKTKGFAIAGPRTTALDIGDEPMQFHEKFPNITVAVGEERFVAIPQILHDRPETSVIILDDAFQHRSVRAGLNIILTDYNNLYTRDLMIPAGDLRDTKISAKRAEIIIVTKCKADLSGDEKEKIIKEIAPKLNQHVFFTEISYAQPYHLFSGEINDLQTNTDILLITGIANPKPMKEFMAAHVHSYDMLQYADHHIFTSNDLREIKKHFEKLSPEKRLIITTEKDGVRLKKFQTELSDLPVFVLPITHRFLFGEGEAFNSLIFDFMGRFNKN